ncbi:MAG: alpha/beta fold hydrolase [Bacteroidia bacterium]|nr:alpha/beta fold hydrolase [Bacteroidia bacterium]
MDYKVESQENFEFIETGADGPTIMLLHGLFGALSNFKSVLEEFGRDYNVVVPLLPIFKMPIRKLGVGGLVKFVEEFVKHKGYDKVHVLGNSLGGHVALIFVLNNPGKISSLTLTGSSGLYESAFGTTFPKRGNYDFIKERTEQTFYDPTVATKELVDEVFGIVNDRDKGIRVIVTAKSAVRHNLADRLNEIKCPTCLIWGIQDTVTPAFVAEQFNEGIENSEVHYIDKCGHAAMMEKPEEFNSILVSFLRNTMGG